MAVDRRAKGYLYAILVKYKDLVFVDTAKTLLITADGRLDGDVLRYLRQVLGTDAMPIFHSVMNDPRLTDDLDRYAIRDAILRHIDTDPQAVALLTQTVREALASQEEGEAFNWGAMKLPLSALMRDADSIPAQTSTQRRQLIENLREEFNHPQLNGALNKMDAGLEAAQQRNIPGGGK
jgi:folate-binding Fe-S cluster repair protein YgfZ